MKATVAVKLKEEILDAPGKAVARQLQSMGYGEVKQVRVAKLIEIEFDAGDRENAERRVQEMAASLLAHSAIEEFQVIAID